MVLKLTLPNVNQLWWDLSNKFAFDIKDKGRFPVPWLREPNVFRTYKSENGEIIDYTLFYKFVYYNMINNGLKKLF